MPHFGQITGSDAADGTPSPDFTLIPIEAMPGGVPVWMIRPRGR